MQLVEQHIIKKTDARYQIIDGAAFKAKNLYNAALYEVRQAFIKEHRSISYPQLHAFMKRYAAYAALPRKVSQQVLKLLDKNWQSFFAACKEYRDHPEQFLGRPKLPTYKHKTEGRFALVYTMQAISIPGLRQGLIVPSQLGIQVKTQQQSLQQIRIVPRKGFYIVEVVYSREVQQAAVDSSLYAGIDIGINNLATLTSNKVGFIPRIVNGRPVKSINQFYNKRKAEWQSKLGHTGTTQRMERMTNKRTRRIDHYLHTASKQIIDLLVAESIGTLVISKNPYWKQACNIGKRNNQHFVSIPHARFIDMSTYKAKLVGIAVILTEESYTSKCSFLDGEGIGKQEVYAGRRVKRGLFRSASGKPFNADVNGSYVRRFGAYQIFPKGDEGEGNRPQGHPTYLTRKLKGENSMLGTRLNGKVRTMMRRKSCTQGEACIG